MIANMHRSREPLVHTAVFVEMIAHDKESTQVIQSSVLAEITRSKMNVDRLHLRQKEGFISVMPSGYNMFKEEFERVLPASSVANLFPFNYSGKTDPKGFHIGSDKYGSNIIVDFNKRTENFTNSNIIILGNSGQGKSYLLKGILNILRQAEMNVIVIDSESEYDELTSNLEGDYIDLTSGQYLINVLEPKRWTDEVLLEDFHDEEVSKERVKDLLFITSHEKQWRSAFVASEAMYIMTVEAEKAYIEYVNKLDQQILAEKHYTFTALMHLHGRALQQF